MSDELHALRQQVATYEAGMQRLDAMVKALDEMVTGGQRKIDRGLPTIMQEIMGRLQALGEPAYLFGHCTPRAWVVDIAHNADFEKQAVRVEWQLWRDATRVRDYWPTWDQANAAAEEQGLEFYRVRPGRRPTLLTADANGKPQRTDDWV